jgi:spore coat protein U-like protein
MMRRLIRNLLTLLLIGFAAGSAQALCITGLCACSTVTTNVAFGNYNPLAFGNVDSTGSIKVSCGGVAGLLIPFKIDFSTGSSGSFSSRSLQSGAYTLSYNLYTDASFTTPWGDGSGASQTVYGGVTLDVLGLSPAQTFWIYGRVPGRQLTVAPGIYTDTINVTLTYY